MGTQILEERSPLQGIDSCLYFHVTQRRDKKPDRFLPVIPWILLCILFISSLPCSTLAGSAIPSEVEINTWWKPDNRKKPGEKIQVNRIVPVYLKSKENAFLATVYFAERGRNFFSGSLLIRPSLKETREADGVGETIEVLDLGNDGISEVSTEIVGSGQGTTAGTKRIVYFEGWKTVVVHEKEFGDNLGECGPIVRRVCYAREVKWLFTDLDGDEKLDLIETIVDREGKEPNKLAWSVSTKGYLFKAGRLSQTAPTLNTKPTNMRK